MQTFKNKNFVKRDYDCTNRVYCRAEAAPTDSWEAMGDIIKFPEGVVMLSIENNVTYYGYL